VLLLIGHGTSQTFFHQRQVPQDRSQGSPQLVRDVREKLVLEPARCEDGDVLFLQLRVGDLQGLVRSLQIVDETSLLGCRRHLVRDHAQQPAGLRADAAVRPGEIEGDRSEHPRHGLKRQGDE
jgi:hypothetical protein